jgi:flavodoxin
MNDVSSSAISAASSKQGQSLHIIFATTSGHTEFVVDTLTRSVELSDWEIEKTLAEKASPQDMLRGAVLLLASSTWNTGGVEGQLNPHMSVLLQSKAKDLDLASKPSACIGLGDHRYYYTARAADLLHDYIESHHGRLLLPALKIVDEPYGSGGGYIGLGKAIGGCSEAGIGTGHESLLDQNRRCFWSGNQFDRGDHR